MNDKTMAVDLGGLQKTFVKAKADLERDTKAFEKASAALDQSRAKHADAHQKLKDSVRTVLA